MPVDTRPLLATALGAALAVGVACGAPARPSAASPSPAASSTTAATSSPGTTGTATPTSPILRMTLTDVRSGERFTLGGFGGKTVIVQGMAVW